MKYFYFSAFQNIFFYTQLPFAFHSSEILSFSSSQRIRYFSRDFFVVFLCCFGNIYLMNLDEDFYIGEKKIIKKITKKKSYMTLHDFSPILYGGLYMTSTLTFFFV